MKKPNEVFPTPEVEALLEAALDPKAHPERAARLASDPATKAAFRSAERAREVVDGLPRPEPSTRLSSTLFQKLEEVDRKENARPLARLFRWLTTPIGGGLVLAAAAAALVLFVYPTTSGSKLPPAIARLEELELAEDLELYRNLELVEHLDVVDELELIQKLPEESG